MSDDRLVLVAVYDEPEKAGKDFEYIKSHHDLNHFHTFNAALIEHRGDEGKKKIIRYEESAVRGMAVGATAGVAVGLVFPPALVAGALIGLGSGGVIAHARHGSDEDVLNALAEALPDGKSIVVVSTTDVDREDTVRGYLSHASVVHQATADSAAAELVEEPAAE